MYTGMEMVERGGLSVMLEYTSLGLGAFVIFALLQWQKSIPAKSRVNRFIVFMFRGWVKNRAKNTYDDSIGRANASKNL
jgi:hypothetical protein